MILGALAVGAITAYYFGSRLGIYAAASSLGLFLIAMINPSLTVLSNGLVGVYLAGVLLIGPGRPQQKERKAEFAQSLRKAGGVLLRLYRRLGQ